MRSAHKVSSQSLKSMLECSLCMRIQVQEVVKQTSSGTVGKVRRLHFPVVCKLVELANLNDGIRL